MTTTVRISGGGAVGEGEDVTYEAEHHDGYSPPDLSGTWTFDDLSERLETLDLAGYRRWGFESAALDLALRQAGTSLGAAVGREYRPVRFVVSTREDIDRYLAVQPTLEFKVDPMSTWSRALIDELAATGRIRVTDLKGYYRGTVVDQPADPRLYRDVVEGFPDAVIEDAAFTDETRPILEAAADRLSFDAPIHSVEDVQALEVEPRWLNIKPSRFGSARRLLDTIAYGEEHGMTLYGGGQFELGVGRSHIQTFASLYYADSANDVAPSLYNEPELPADAPASPLPAPSEPQGARVLGPLGGARRNALFRRAALGRAIGGIGRASTHRTPTKPPYHYEFREARAARRPILAAWPRAASAARSCPRAPVSAPPAGRPSTPGSARSGRS